MVKGTQSSIAALLATVLFAANASAEIIPFDRPTQSKPQPVEKVRVIQVQVPPRPKPVEEPTPANTYKPGNFSGEIGYAPYARSADRSTIGNTFPFSLTFRIDPIFTLGLDGSVNTVNTDSRSRYNSFSIGPVFKLKTDPVKLTVLAQVSTVDSVNAELTGNRNPSAELGLDALVPVYSDLALVGSCGSRFLLSGGDSNALYASGGARKGLNTTTSLDLRLNHVHDGFYDNDLPYGSADLVYENKDGLRISGNVMGGLRSGLGVSALLPTGSNTAIRIGASGRIDRGSNTNVTQGNAHVAFVF